jgi:hypothetical protein
MAKMFYFTSAATIRQILKLLIWVTETDREGIRGNREGYRSTKGIKERNNGRKR